MRAPQVDEHDDSGNPARPTARAAERSDALAEEPRTRYPALQRAREKIRTVTAGAVSGSGLVRRNRPAFLGAAGLLLLGAAVLKGFHRIHEGEIAVFVNNLSGAMYVEERAGFHFSVPWVYSPYRLPRSIQSLTMSEQGATGFRGGDAVKLKTSDGSNVSVDTQVSYRLLPQHAAELLRTAGPGLAFGDIWVRPAVRAMIAREYGSITTEQVYDATIRNERARAVVDGLNRELEARGVEIVAVVPQEFRFYKEYEEVIKRKKLADQEVEEEQAKARLAQEEKKKKVAEAEFAAAARKATAAGEAERLLAETAGYESKVRLEAEGALASTIAQAEGQLATGMADAEGLKKAAAALEGPGGVNLVALEYAKQIGKITFTGVAVLQDGHVAQYRVTQAGAAPRVASNGGAQAGSPFPGPMLPGSGGAP